MEVQSNNKRNIIIGGIVALLIAIVGFVFINNNKTSDTQHYSKNAIMIGNNRSEYIKKDGSFMIGKDGAIPVADQNNKSARLDVYFDFMCPGCGIFERKAGEVIQKYINKGDIQARYFPLMFLDQVEGSNEYSSRSAAYMLGVVEYAPKLALKYMETLFGENFQPDESAPRNITNGELEKTFLSIGGTKSQLNNIKTHLNDFKAVPKATTTEAINGPKLRKQSSTGTLTTPFVVPYAPNKTDGMSIEIGDVEGLKAQMEEVIKDITK